MELIPAIDIRDGRCVRLLYGDFDQETRYELDPRELAREYRDAGARWLHIVDLDGAESGRRKNAALIREIAAASELRVQLGGGIRDEASLQEALECADRAVIGSLAVTEPDTVSSWLKQYGAERIALGLDVRLGADGAARVATHGWTEASELSLDAAIERYIPAGLVHVLCTDVARDGAMTGPNVQLYALAAIGVPAAISGKALLDKKILLEEVASFLPNA
jgi:phosphoribosylformimino-5-aminoimidazole carboxamide ribotide isomerase